MHYFIVCNCGNTTDNFEMFGRLLTCFVTKGHQDPKFWFHFAFLFLRVLLIVLLPLRNINLELYRIDTW